MRPGTSHSEHRSPERGATVSVASVSCLCGLCVSAFSLNFQLSTVDSAISGQPPCFDNLAHSSDHPRKDGHPEEPAATKDLSLSVLAPPLCFHNLMNSFSRSSFPLITLQIAGGCIPRFSNSFIINNSPARPKNMELFRRQNRILNRVRDSADESRPKLRRAKVPGAGSFRNRKK